MTEWKARFYVDVKELEKLKCLSRYHIAASDRDRLKDRLNQRVLLKNNQWFLSSDQKTYSELKTNSLCYVMPIF